MKLNRQEVARYLGYGRQEVEPHIDAIITECEKAIRKLRPSYLARKIEKDSLDFAESEDIERHIIDCPSVWLVVVTLGSEADRLLRMYAASNMAKGAVMQASMSALLEQYLMAYLKELEKPEKGEYLKSPYSPGYGDFSLSWQSVLLDYLDARKRIGVYLTEAGMLVPEKTITAVVGVCDTKPSSCDRSCALCNQEDCTFRKE